MKFKYSASKKNLCAKDKTQKSIYMLKINKSYLYLQGDEHKTSVSSFHKFNESFANCKWISLSDNSSFISWNDLYSLLGVESEDLVSEVLVSCGIEIGFDLTGKLKLSPGLYILFLGGLLNLEDPEITMGLVEVMLTGWLLTCILFIDIIFALLTSNSVVVVVVCKNFHLVRDPSWTFVFDFVLWLFRSTGRLIRRTFLQV